ncbi:hypothetical protein GCM10027053_02210 [Intrasporangium mesophilum]
MLRNLSPAHIMIIAIALVVLFGWKRLPDMARSLGRSARVFKSEVDEMRNDGRSTTAAAPTTPDAESMDQAQRDAEAKLAEAEARLAQARSDAERLRGDSRL